MWYDFTYYMWDMKQKATHFDLKKKNTLVFLANRQTLTFASTSYLLIVGSQQVQPGRWFLLLTLLTFRERKGRRERLGVPD